MSSMNPPWRVYVFPGVPGLGSKYRLLFHLLGGTSVIPDPPLASNSQNSAGLEAFGNLQPSPMIAMAPAFAPDSTDGARRVLFSAPTPAADAPSNCRSR